MMSITEAIYACRAVRQFTTEPVPEAAVHALLYAGVQAWEGRDEVAPVFAVIRNPAVLKDLPGLSVFQNAETLIIIYGYAGMGDAFLAAQTIRLAAVGMGLGTCLAACALEALNTTDWRARLEVPESLTAMAAIAIGYPAQNAEAVTRQPPDILNWIA